MHFRDFWRDMLALLVAKTGKEESCEHAKIPRFNTCVNKIGPLFLFLVETMPFRKQFCRKQLGLYSKKKLRVIYCIFVLEGLEEFNGQILWFHKEKPAWTILN